MACYTRVGDLSKEVIEMNQADGEEDESLMGGDRLTPNDAQWLTMQAFCKRCCHHKQQLTSAHLTCLGLRNRGF